MRVARDPKNESEDFKLKEKSHRNLGKTKKLWITIAQLFLQYQI